MIHHMATAVRVIDIATDNKISFAHSQYDAHAIPGRLHTASLLFREISASASAVCAMAPLPGDRKMRAAAH
jgi:hypothetical protein